MEPYGGLTKGDGQRAAPARVGPHLLVCGPTGSGKTRRVLAPGAALHRGGPVVTVSSKADLAALVGQAWEAQGHAVRQFVLDLRPRTPGLNPPPLPPRATRVRFDPCGILAGNLDEALTTAETLLDVGAVGSGESSQDGFWNNQASSPLAALLLAGEQRGGIRWALAALSNPGGEDEDGENWATAATLAAYPHGESLAALIVAEQRLRDSLAATMGKALSAWRRLSVLGDKGTPHWSPWRLLADDGTPTALHIIAPADGVSAGAAVAVVDHLVRFWRGLTDDPDRDPGTLALVIDELANTAPLPGLLAYVTEARGLGVAITAAVQASEQLALRWGTVGRDVLRETFPAALILRGAPERVLLENAAFWGGRTERRYRTTDETGRVSGVSSTAEDAVYPAELVPPSLDRARLLRAGEPGELVAVPDISAWWRGL